MLALPPPRLVLRMRRARRPALGPGLHPARTRRTTREARPLGRRARSADAIVDGARLAAIVTDEAAVAVEAELGADGEVAGRHRTGHRVRLAVVAPG